MKLDIDHENGGMKLDENFLIDFGAEPDGPVLAHETRFAIYLIIIIVLFFIFIFIVIFVNLNSHQNWGL